MWNFSQWCSAAISLRACSGKGINSLSRWHGCKAKPSPSLLWPAELYRAGYNTPPLHFHIADTVGTDQIQTVTERGCLGYYPNNRVDQASFGEFPLRTDSNSPSVLMQTDPSRGIVSQTPPSWQRPVFDQSLRYAPSSSMPNPTKIRSLELKIVIPTMIVIPKSNYVRVLGRNAACNEESTG